MKTLEVGYKRFMDDFSDYLTCSIKSQSKEQAIIQLVMEYEGISKQEAKEFIVSCAGENWNAEDAVERINPLGSPDSALYRFNYIKEIKDVA
jgi:hypothetical protein